MDGDEPGSYQVKGETFSLPPASKGKPLTSAAIAGLIDHWPAHASGRVVPTSQVAVTRNKRLVVLEESETKLPNLVPKPKFLVALEKHVEKELARHHVEAVEPNSVRLQIYREVFEWLIEAFQTYRPLLAEVKREYEMMLAHYREEIRKLEPMKEMLWTLSQDCDNRIMRMRSEEKQDMKNLRQEKLDLENVIAEQNGELLQLKCQIDKLKSELAEEHKKYRDSADALKLLNIEFNNLRAELAEEASHKKSEEEEDENSPENVQILKVAYIQAKKAHAEAIAKLNKMEADYNDVVPRRDFETLSADHQKLSEEHGKLLGETQAAQSQAIRLKLQLEECMKERNEYFTKYEALQRSSTPRPNWDKCAEQMYGGAERWEQITEGKTSAEKMNILLEELLGGGGGSGTTGQFVEPKGLGEDVPTFLRHDQPVANRRMSKRDCRLLIRELWDQRKVQKEEVSKAVAAGENREMQKINDFIHEAFQKLFGMASMRVEWAYSLYDAVHKFSDDFRVKQFLDIIEGRTDEECYWEEMRRMGTLFEQMQQADKEERGLLSKPQLKEVLHLAYPKLDEEALDHLMELLNQELEAANDELVEYQNLFFSDDEGEFGVFLQEIRSNFYKDRAQYISEVAAEISELGESHINPATLRLAFSIVDPSIDKERLDYYVSWAFQTPISAIEQCEPEDLAVLTERLNRGNVNRVGRRN